MATKGKKSGSRKPGKHKGHHKPKPYREPGYDKPHDRPKQPPAYPDYPYPDLYGSYATDEAPPYIPHPLDHSCFRPREEDYKPPVTCDEDPDDGLCHRKDSRTLTADEQTRFLNAYTQAIAIGALGPLVDIHANSSHLMHNHPRFLPWHRIYLVKMEQLLLSIDPTVCLPYWRSSEEQAFPSWLLGFTPTVDLIGGPHTVNRNIGMFATLPDAAAVAAEMAETTFNDFSDGIEGIHDSGHVWVGGSMMAFATAPSDPAFWMHHAEIDRLWAEWQVANPGLHPALAGADAVMDPWPETEVDTRDIAALGYTYD